MDCTPARGGPFLSAPARRGYEVAPVCCRGEVNNGEDDLSKAFMDPDFPHDERSTKNERLGNSGMVGTSNW